MLLKVVPFCATFEAIPGGQTGQLPSAVNTIAKPFSPELAESMCSASNVKLVATKEIIGLTAFAYDSIADTVMPSPSAKAPDSALL